MNNHLYVRTTTTYEPDHEPDNEADYDSLRGLGLRALNYERESCNEPDYEPDIFAV